MLRPDPTNPLFLIPATLAADPDSVAVLPVFSPHDPESSLVLRARTKLRRLPPDLAAELARRDAAASGNGERAALPTHLEVGHLLLTVPADVAQNLCGPLAERHPIYLFLVRREAYDNAVRQADTGLVLPGPGVGMPGRGIVKP
jgi:hypothetical protein